MTIELMIVPPAHATWPLGVPDSCKYSLNASLEADVWIICCVYLWYYIVGVRMCGLLVLVLWCVLCIHLF